MQIIYLFLFHFILFLINNINRVNAASIKQSRWLASSNDEVASESTIPRKHVTSICAGDSHTCITFNDKKMKCWGRTSSWGSSFPVEDLLGDEAGELGDNIPYINVGTGVGINKVICGSFHICMIIDTEDMKCLGFNLNGQSGAALESAVIGSFTGFIGDNLPIVNLGSGMNVSQIVAGYAHTCTVVAGSWLKCFGYNNRGQLGYGDTVNRGRLPYDMGENLTFIDFGTNVEVASVHSGSSSYHNCVILSAPASHAQRIKCWGHNHKYQLGYGDTNNRGDEFYEMGDNLTFVELGIESRVKQIATGEGHTCTLLLNDMLKCFGDGAGGQLGSGSTSIVSNTGDAIPYATYDAKRGIGVLTAGLWHTCILYDDMMGLKCFGWSTQGTLGQGDPNSRGDTPSTMIPNIPLIQLGSNTGKIYLFTSGTGHSCVVFTTYLVKCFGRGSRGQIGVGSTQHIGDQGDEMGDNLQYVVLFWPTTSPSRSPTQSPSKNPTKNPTTNSPTYVNLTKKPTTAPSLSPTRQCNYEMAKLCRYDYKCMWIRVSNVKKCVVFDCTLLNKGKCKKDMRCKWTDGRCSSF